MRNFGHTTTKRNTGHRNIGKNAIANCSFIDAVPGKNSNQHRPIPKLKFYLFESPFNGVRVLGHITIHPVGFLMLKTIAHLFTVYLVTHIIIAFSILQSVELQRCFCYRTNIQTAKSPSEVEKRKRMKLLTLFAKFFSLSNILGNISLPQNK